MKKEAQATKHRNRNKMTNVSRKKCREIRKALTLCDIQITTIIYATP